MKDKVFQCYLLICKENNLELDLQELLNKLKLNTDSKNPDYTTISPVKNNISIDEIRNLKKQIYQKPVKYDKKLTVIKNAEKLTTEAQNSLLKILEEPPSFAIIILACTNKSKILNTITSRTVVIYPSKHQKNDQEEKNTFESQKEKLLGISEITNTDEFIDVEIQSKYISLKEAILAGKHGKAAVIEQNLRSLKETKKMLGANINKTFSLANFFLNEKTSPK